MRQQISSTPRSSQGFSLIELLVALVTAGLLASLTSLALIPTLQRNQLNTATDQIVQTLIRTQQQAEARSTSYILQLDTISTGGIPTSPVRYRAYDTALTAAQIAAQPWQVLPSGIYFGTTATFGANAQAQTNFPVDALGAQYRSVTFDETGAASTIGQITLALSDPGAVRSVARIRIQTLLGGVTQDCLVGGAATATNPSNGQTGRC